jgi:endoglucanase
MHQPVEHPLPRVVHVGAVAKDIVCLEIHAGEVICSPRYVYRPQPGDRIESEGNGRKLYRDDEPVGWIVGEGMDLPELVSDRECRLGAPLDEDAGDRPESYRIRTIDAAGQASGRHSPQAVHRKSKVDGWPLPDRDSPVMRHWIYLRMPGPLDPTATYQITLAGLDANPRHLVYRHVWDRVVSEAVHCTHLGFRPDDPAKCAYLSCWMGTGGGVRYDGKLTFAVVDATTGQRVHEGAIDRLWSAEKPEAFVRGGNYNHCDVWRIDFAALHRPGEYRVVVDGIGCSRPFSIAKNVWARAFGLTMQGVYHQRSGVAVGPPEASLHRHRGFRPADGLKVYHNRVSLLESSNGLDARGDNQKGTVDFNMLVEGITDELVPDAWGGYMDAADWDRRIKHLDATRLHLELLELFPDYFSAVRLSIPKSGGPLPDLLQEALFGIGVYRRLQREDGAVRGGIESTDHCAPGECSWQESLRVFAYAPDAWSSWIYAGVAARLARVLRRFGRQDMAADWQQSAEAAMDWAETELVRLDDSGELAAYREYARVHMREERALAAVELWTTTGQGRYHELFDKVHDLGESPEALNLYYRRAAQDAAFVYARLSEERCEAPLRDTARSFVLAGARRAMSDAAGNAWSKEHGYRPSMGFAGLTEMDGPGYGYWSIPASAALLRGHFLTEDAGMLATAVVGAGFASGGSPLNRAFTTGMGHDPVAFIQHNDTRRTAQRCPDGITVYGLFDIPTYRDHPISTLSWAPKYYLQHQCTPSAYDWPIGESYFDVGCWLPNTEFTVHHTLGPASYAYGYLAGRGQVHRAAIGGAGQREGRKTHHGKRRARPAGPRRDDRVGRGDC